MPRMNWQLLIINAIVAIIAGLIVAWLKVKLWKSPTQ